MDATTPPPAAAAATAPPAAGTTPPPAAEKPTVAAPSLVDQALKQDETPKPTDAKGTDAKPGAIELKLPDGFVADQAALDTFKTTASELGLDGPKAQKLFDQYVALETARNAAAEKSVAEQEAKWSAEVQADPDLGGAKLPVTIREVRAAVDFLGKDFGTLIAKTGFGSHPSVVRALVKVGRALKDDSIAGTSKTAPPASERKSDAELFYGTPTAAAKEQ